MHPDRPFVSGSNSGHCRMEIWMLGHAEPLKLTAEEALPHSQRTFDIGHMVENLMFDGLDFGTMKFPPWWPQIGEVMDYSTGQVINTKDWTVTRRQEEVEVNGFVGHVDGVLEGKGTMLLPDVKTMPSFTWDRNLKDDLMKNPFSREYVMQLQFYLEGFRLKGLPISDGLLVNFNKENSKVAVRFVPYNADLVSEVKERLSWTTSDIAPTPDWEWEKGKPVPLRCGYCNLRSTCAAIRGRELTLKTEKGYPKWIVS